MYQTGELQMKNYRIYKPKKDGKGAATQLEVRKDKKDEYSTVLIFLKGANQTGFYDNKNAKFAWAKDEEDLSKIVNMKLGESDIGDLLAVLNGKKDKVGQKESGIYHQNPKGNTTLKFEWMEKYGQFGLRLASKPNDGNLIEVKHFVSQEEGQVLKVLLEQALLLYYDAWKL